MLFHVYYDLNADKRPQRVRKSCALTGQSLDGEKNVTSEQAGQTDEW